MKSDFISQEKKYFLSVKLNMIQWIAMSEKNKTFEESLTELEELVSAMESGNMGLEEMVVAFEKGQKLVKTCGQRLNEVEKRIEVIKKGASESVATSPLPPMEQP